MKRIKQFRIIIIAAILYLAFFILKRDVFFDAVSITAGFFKEMIQVLPPVMILSALITVWVPSATIQKGLGEKSGFKGRILAVLIGSVSAGPIYAAFPAALVLFKKGASISNMVIILSSWAVIKVPMLMVEIQFLGIQFSVVRFILTVPAVILIGMITEKMVKRYEIKEEQKESRNLDLPNLNCGGCGYNSCADFKQAVLHEGIDISGCIILNKE